MSHSRQDPLAIGARRLTLEDVLDVARSGRPVSIDEGARNAMSASALWVQHAADQLGAGAEPTYGINTGFGSLAGRQAFATPEHATELSRRLVISNAAGVGRRHPDEVVRAALLIRIASLVRGYSGVRPEIVDTLVQMLNRGVTPVVPEHGSLGASGDLIPLAHVALVATRPDGQDDPEVDSGQARLDGEVLSGTAAMRRAGIARVVLRAKEGLALLNGTAFSTALCALALADAERLVRTSEVTLAMTTEALLGFGDAFIDEIHTARGHAGQVESAAHVRALLEGSRLIDGGRDRDPTRHPPQDAYSIRCAPQVLGAVRDALTFVRQTVEIELDAATDNPLVFCDLPEARRLKAVSGGNFHAQPIAFAADFLSICVTEIASIAERRLFRLDDGTLNRGLPDMLIDSEDVGLDCGYMLPQYLAAGLVSDCKTLAHPDSVDSIPTCANQEDHVSMAANAGRHARQVVANAEGVVAIEVLMAAQAMDLRAREPDRGLSDFSSAARRVHELVRTSVAADGRALDFLERDAVLYPRLETAIDLVHSGAVLAAADQGAVRP